jgi:hypothetical protein
VSSEGARARPASGRGCADQPPTRLRRSAAASARTESLALLRCGALAAFSFVAVLATGALADAQDSTAAELTGVAAVADAVLAGRMMPPPDRTTELPSDVQSRLAEYRRCETTFASAITPPRGATPEEERLFEQRVGIERVVFCLFPKQDVAHVASAYALDADLGFAEAAFIDTLLRDLRQRWLAPYLNLIAGALKLCDGRITEGRRQLALARGGGEPLIRAVADHLLTTTAVRPCSPSP